MRVAIIGAGVAGLVNARTLSALGADVVVLEARADLGGVWSGTRGYPGQRLQNDKGSYAFSDFPMPAHYPEHPDRAQVQEYLTAYARHHDLERLLRLSTTVVRAEHLPDGQGWRLTTIGPDGPSVLHADRLIVANGTLSTPDSPALPGAEEFARGGGRIVDAADLGEAPWRRGERVAVLGFGKSATDIAVAAAADGVEVDVLARSVPWKLPERIGRVPWQALVNSRVGEHLLWAPFRTVGGRVLRRVDTLVRLVARALLARRVREQLRLDARGLVPTASFQALSHLVTPGFDEAVDAGAVRLHVGARVDRLGAGPAVHLEDGRVLPADLLVLATGYRTDIAFLDERTRGLLLDEQGRMPLRRHTQPVAAPDLVFAGWANSFRSPIAAELQAVWIAALLHGAVEPRRRSGSDRAEHPAPTGLSIVDQDAWLDEAGVALPRAARRAELLHALDPAAYAGVQLRLGARLAALDEAAAPAQDALVALPIEEVPGSAEPLRSAADRRG